MTREGRATTRSQRFLLAERLITFGERSHVSEPERMTRHVPDLAGKTIVVTGANSDLGYEAIRVFARRNATVVMACRDTDRADEAAREVSREVPDASLSVAELDLADLVR